MLACSVSFTQAHLLGDVQAVSRSTLTHLSIFAARAGPAKFSRLRKMEATQSYGASAQVFALFIGNDR
jgi:hypothetical protein